MTQICVPLSPANDKECCDAMAHLASRCDLFEIRADAFQERPDLPLIFKRATRPVIWTHRCPEEGGRHNPRQRDRLQEYRRALDCGVNWIDVEWRSGLAEPLRAFADKTVLSLHDFGKTPHDLLHCIRQMTEVPCGVVKVATRVERTEDLLRLIECAHWLLSQGKRVVVLGLGDDGKPIRVLSPLLGCEWTYAALDTPTAPGQLTESDLELYRFTALGRQTRLFAVIGNPIAHSRSPWFHNSAYQTMNLNAVYVAIRVDNLDAYLKLAQQMNISGWSVTLPWKTEVAGRCLLQDEASRRSGVVNTVRPDGDRYLGWNTDWAGFIEPIRKRCPVGHLRACVLGTGGVARTAVAALISEGAQVTVLGRRLEVLHLLENEFRIETGLLEDSPEVSGDLIVNATSVGMSPAIDAMPVPDSLLERFQIAYDLVYTPPLTSFLRNARQLGLQTISGWEMFVQQAAEQVRIFTGNLPPREWLEGLTQRRKDAETPGG
ncbi:MAG TPA: type I 3-dehydroquinate dehydratase [Acidobacteriota bacterium]|nr:type I 3-dehydroquinate dehydratase [Acidobacteriota bacterium]